MNNEKKQRESVKTLIEYQLKVLTLCNRSKTITLSLPKTSLDRDALEAILLDVLGYKPNISFYQEINVDDSTSVILITLEIA